MTKEVQSCQICSFPASQTKIILKSLFARMDSLKYQVIKPLKDHGPEDSFTKLLNSFFRLSPKVKFQSLKCSHSKLLKLFQEKLQCTKEGLNEASDFLMMEQIKRSYQLEVISCQFRQINGTIVKGTLEPGINKDQIFPYLNQESFSDVKSVKKIDSQQESERKNQTLKNSFISSPNIPPYPYTDPQYNPYGQYGYIGYPFMYGHPSEKPPSDS